MNNTLLWLCENCYFNIAQWLKLADSGWAKAQAKPQPQARLRPIIMYCTAKAFNACDELIWADLKLIRNVIIY